MRERFTFADQSFHGWSATGKSSGRPDGIIFDKHSNAFSVYEGLNISSSSDSIKKIWNDHLDKLISNYNPNGLKRLFLVSYVESSKFSDLCNRYYDHMSAYAPNGWSLLRRIPGYAETNNIKYAECTYEKGGAETIVCYIFVLMDSQ